MKPRSRLERWIVYGNCLIGYVYEDRNHDPGTRVMTEVIRFIDRSNNYAETLDERFILGEPGLEWEHSYPIISPGKSISEDQKIILENS